MAFKVTNNLDAAVWLSQSDTLPFELWHNVATFLVEPKLENYIILDDRLVVCIEPGHTKMMPLRMFRKKKLIPRMHRKKIGNIKQFQEISFDLLCERKTIKDVLSLTF
jgi:hypothetical protein